MVVLVTIFSVMSPEIDSIYKKAVRQRPGGNELGAKQQWS